MAITSFGDMAQTFMLRAHNARLRADLQRQGQEATTGQVADVGRRVAGDFSPLAGLERSLARLTSFAVSTNEARLFGEATQTALGAIGDLATGLAPGLLTASQAGQPSHVDAIASEAGSRFEAALSRLNTRVGDRSLFAGVATDGPAVADSETILAALGTAVAGATSADAVVQAVSDWFDDPAGWATIGYLGAPATLAPVAIDEGVKVALDATALDPAVRETLKGLATAALLETPILTGDIAERAALARKAGESLLAAQSGWTGMQSRLGVAQERIEETALSNSAERAALQIARTNLLSVDPYEAATALQDTQTQLETLYSITARLSRLTLTDYL